MGGPRASLRSLYVCHEVPHALDFPSARVVQELGRAGHVEIAARYGDRTEVDGVRISTYGSTRGLVRLARDLRPDLVFMDNPSSELVLLAALPRARYWLREPVPAASWRVSWAKHALVARADLLTFTNPASQASWGRWARRTAPLLYPVDVAFFEERVPREEGVWRELGMPVPTGPVILCIANVYPVKRLPEVVEALAPLLRRLPGARLLFLGHLLHEQEATRLRAAIAASGVQEQALLLGAADHTRIRRLLPWASFAVVNSASETQCLSLYECLAGGVPVLIPRIAQLTSAFPGLWSHGDGTELLANAERCLGDEKSAMRRVEACLPQVQAADISRHDANVQEGLRELSLA